MSSAQMLYQYMSADGRVVTEPSLPPLVKIELEAESVVEGGSINIRVSRTRNVFGECSVKWTATGLGGHLSGTLSDTVTLGAGITQARFTVTTVNLSGTQGERDVVVVLSEPSGCVLDPLGTTTSFLIKDKAAVSTDWWSKDVAPYRSGRDWASGYGYINAASRFPKFEREVGLMDAGCGNSEGGNGGDYVRTMEDLIGGPLSLTNYANIGRDTHVGWLKQVTAFSSLLNYAPKPTLATPNGRCWFVWAHHMFPVGSAFSTQGGSVQSWNKIIAGDWDDYYIEMGKRIKWIFEQYQQPLSRLILRTCHEFNQSNNYQVFESTVGKWKDACNRFYDKLREGAEFHIRACVAPAPNSRIGSFKNLIPSGVDAISISYHVGTFADTNADITKFFNGELNGRYGIISDVVGAADDLGLPLMFPEWSPRHEWGDTARRKNATLVADKATERFYDEILVPNKSRIVCDVAYNETMIEKTAYERPDAGGQAAWERHVDSYKSKWSGNKLAA